jgi:hypothetical protein
MDHMQGLRDSDSSLVLSQSIEPLKRSLDLTLSQQLLCELLWGNI